MASTFTTSLKFNKPALGDAGWGTAVNGGFTDLVDQALGGQASINVGSGPGPFVLTIPDGASGDARNMFIRATGNPGGAREIQVPANRKLYFVTNDSDGAVTVKVSGQTGVVVPVGASVALRINAAGTDVAPALTYQASMTLGTALAATSGGTGQSSYAVGDLLYADTTTTLAKLTVGAANAVLTSSGTVPQWSATLPVASGGTGAATLAANNVLLGNGTSAVQEVAPGTAGNVLRSNGTTWTSSALSSATDTAEGLVELATTAEVQTGTDTTRVITPAGLRNGALVFDTVRTPTSGTTVNFTSIPSWVKRITVVFVELTTASNTGTLQLRLGVGGVVETSNYFGAYGLTNSGGGAGAGTWSSSMVVGAGDGASGVTFNGSVILTRLSASSNTWIAQSVVTERVGETIVWSAAGSKALAGTLDMVQVLLSSSTFSSGSVNIMYE